MGNRVDDLARAVDQATMELAGVIEKMSADQWQSNTSAEGWTKAAVAHHVAVSHLSPGVVQFVTAIANGQSVPDLTIEQVHDMNAQHAAEFATADKAETLALLNTNAAAVAAAIRGYSDAQLDRSQPMAIAGGNPLSTEQLIQALWIGTLGEHVASARS